MSTVKQDLDRQIDALEQTGIPRDRIYVDRKSGATTDRPGLRAVIAYARASDAIVVHTRIRAVAYAQLEWLWVRDDAVVREKPLWRPSDGIDGALG